MFSFTSMASSAGGYIATVAIWTVGEVLVSGVSQAIVADLAPSRLAGRYYGTYGVAWSAALVAAPIVGTRVREVSSTLLWLGCGGICAKGLAVTADAVPVAANMPPGRHSATKRLRKSFIRFPVLGMTCVLGPCTQMGLSGQIERIPTQ